MKLQIDTINKVIKIEEKVNIGEFIEKLQSLLPDNWREFTLECTHIYFNSTPIVIDRYHTSETPMHPNTYPWITYCTNTGNMLKSGIFDIELT